MKNITIMVIVSCLLNFLKCKSRKNCTGICQTFPPNKKNVGWTVGTVGIPIRKKSMFVYVCKTIFVLSTNMTRFNIDLTLDLNDLYNDVCFSIVFQQFLKSFLTPKFTFWNLQNKHWGSFRTNPSRENQHQGLQNVFFSVFWRGNFVALIPKTPLNWERNSVPYHLWCQCICV